MWVISSKKATWTLTKERKNPTFTTFCGFPGPYDCEPFEKYDIADYDGWNASAFKIFPVRISNLIEFLWVFRQCKLIHSFSLCLAVSWWFLVIQHKSMFKIGIFGKCLEFLFGKNFVIFLRHFWEIFRKLIPHAQWALSIAHACYVRDLVQIHFPFHFEKYNSLFVVNLGSFFRQI